jgi:hypothetical protein
MIWKTIKDETGRMTGGSMSRTANLELETVFKGLNSFLEYGCYSLR